MPWRTVVRRILRPSVSKKWLDKRQKKSLIVPPGRWGTAPLTPFTGVVLPSPTRPTVSSHLSTDPSTCESGDVSSRFSSSFLNYMDGHFVFPPLTDRKGLVPTCSLTWFDGLFCYSKPPKRGTSLFYTLPLFTKIVMSINLETLWLKRRVCLGF